MARYLKTERGALTGLGACVFAVCLVLATGFYFLVKTASETGDAALLDISRHRAEIAQGPAKREAFLSLNRAMREQPGAVGGETLPLAAAKLDGDVKAMLQEQGADVRSSQILPAGKEKGFETIAIEYDFIIAMEKLEPLLYALQTHNPFLFAENATIAGEDDAGDDKAKPLHLHIVLRAYRWAGHQW
jgi:hypothetical protein